MKKIFIFLALSLAAGLTIWYFSTTRKNQNVVQESAGIAAEEPQLLPVYKGEAIDEIGNDPFIKLVPAAYLEKYKKELADFKTSLSNDPSDVEKWLRVGVLKKFFNDYTGARDIWEYAKLVNPHHSVSYYNLGGLYAGYLKDNKKAEANYLKAIKIDSQQPYFYLALADFYNVFYKEKSDQALSVINQGLRVLPGDASLLQALEKYQKTN